VTVTRGVPTTAANEPVRAEKPDAVSNSIARAASCPQNIGSQRGTRRRKGSVARSRCDPDGCCSNWNSRQPATLLSERASSFQVGGRVCLRAQGKRSPPQGEANKRRSRASYPRYLHAEASLALLSLNRIKLARRRQAVRLGWSRRPDSLNPFLTHRALTARSDFDRP